MASVDYYHGQALDEIVFGEEDWQWALRLSGGAVIKNWDKRRTAAPELSEGDGFLTTIFSADETRLQFGSVDPSTNQTILAGEVVFTPTQYSITDPVYAAEEEFPQRQTEMVVEDPNAVYPEELLAREAQGPENQEDEIATEEVEPNTSENEVEADSSESTDDESNS